MSSYLTTATAASTYASKTATADQSFAGNIVVGTGKALSTPAITLNGTDLTATLQTFLTTTSATSLYQTISGMSSYLTTATAASTYASKTATADQSFAGNIVVGTGKTVSTPAITLNSVDLNTTLTGKASLTGATFTGTVSGTTASTSDSSTKFATTAYVQNNLANYQAQHWVAGRVSSTGTIKTTSGLQTFTVSKGATNSGYYKIQWSTGHPNGNAYGVLLTTTQSYYCTYATITSTYFDLYMYTPGGAAADQEFTFVSVP